MRCHSFYKEEPSLECVERADNIASLPNPPPTTFPYASPRHGTFPSRGELVTHPYTLGIK